MLALRFGILMERDPFGKPVSTRRIKSEGVLFRIMSYFDGA
jgi:hypothetical protein